MFADRLRRRRSASTLEERGDVVELGGREAPRERGHPAATSREYLAEVVRVDALPNGLNGIGIKLLMEMGMQHSYSFTPPTQRK